MSNSYSPIYIDLSTGQEYYLDTPIHGAYAQIKYIQSTADLVWNITHNKNSNRVIVSVNTGLPDIEIVDLNNIKISFNSPQIGEAILIFFE